MKKFPWLAEQIRVFFGNGRKSRLSRTELAIMLGIAPINVTRWAKGRASVPWWYWKMIAEVLGITLQDILRHAQQEVPRDFELFQSNFSNIPPGDSSVVAKSQAASGGTEHIINVIRRLGRQERETLEFCAEAMASGDEEIRHHLIHQLRIVMDALKVRRPSIRGHPQKEQGGTSGPAKDRLERSAG